MQPSSALGTRLAEKLPLNVKLRVYHVSTPPTKSTAIFSAPPDKDEELTFCENHFLAVSRPGTDDHGELFLLAIELLIFTTKDLTTIFVSKADSTGFISSLNLPKGSPSIIRIVIETFLDFLLHARLNEKRVVLSLFARSQNQYLFPGSIDNKDKHVLDDRQLIKWWCRVLDSVWRPLENLTGQNVESTDVHAHVVVPGCDKAETRAFFPNSARFDLAMNPKWIASYPVDAIISDTSLPTRCLIPRLPDDPKARFLDDLDGDYISPQGQWRSIKSLDQFWEMMSYRQECSAGRLVGFVWVVFLNQLPEEQGENGEQNQDTNSRTTLTDLLPTPPQSQSLVNTEQLARSPSITDIVSISTSEPEKPPTSEPSASLQSELVKDVEQVSEASVPNGHGGTLQDLTTQPSPIRWPEKTRGQVVIDSDKYQNISDHMLSSDYEGAGAAAASTSSWIAEVLKATGCTCFGVDVIGTDSSQQNVETKSTSVPPINILSGIRKKRKAADSVAEEVTSRPAVQDTPTLSANLIRKKPKFIEPPS